jgi:hypothetical protein
MVTSISPCPTPKLKGHLLSPVRDYFRSFCPYFKPVFSIQNLKTHRVVATRDHSTWTQGIYPFLEWDSNPLYQCLSSSWPYEPQTMFRKPFGFFNWEIIGLLKWVCAAHALRCVSRQVLGLLPTLVVPVGGGGGVRKWSTRRRFVLWHPSGFRLRPGKCDGSHIASRHLTSRQFFLISAFIIDVYCSIWVTCRMGIFFYAISRSLPWQSSPSRAEVAAHSHSVPVAKGSWLPGI